MDPARPIRSDDPPLALHDRAADDLRFIRRTMERSSAFTAVSGSAGIAMGALALVAAWLTRGTPPERWVALWMGAAALGFVIAFTAMAYKARRTGEPILRGAGRKFLLGTLPALMVGGLLTLPLLNAGAAHLLPGAWLLLYGTAVLGGGAFSVRIVPLMGATFLGLGAVVLALPVLGNLLMALGFGVFHIGFGAVIAVRHGG